MTSVHGARPFIYKGLHRALKIVAMQVPKRSAIKE